MIGNSLTGQSETPFSYRGSLPILSSGSTCYIYGLRLTESIGGRRPVTEPLAASGRRGFTGKRENGLKKF